MAWYFIYEIKALSHIIENDRAEGCRIWVENGLL